MKKLFTLAIVSILLISSGCKKEELAANPLAAQAFKALPYNPTVKLSLYSFVKKDAKRSFVWIYKIENYTNMMAKYGGLKGYTTNRSDYFQHEKTRIKAALGLNLIASFNYETGMITLKATALSTNNYKKVVRGKKISLSTFSLNIKGNKNTGTATPLLPALPTN